MQVALAIWQSHGSPLTQKTHALQPEYLQTILFPDWSQDSESDLALHVLQGLI